MLTIQTTSSYPADKEELMFGSGGEIILVRTPARCDFAVARGPPAIDQARDTDVRVMAKRMDGIQLAMSDRERRGCLPYTTPHQPAVLWVTLFRLYSTSFDLISLPGSCWGWCFCRCSYCCGGRIDAVTFSPLILFILRPFGSPCSFSPSQLSLLALGSCLSFPFASTQIKRAADSNSTSATTGHRRASSLFGEHMICTRLKQIIFMSFLFPGLLVVSSSLSLNLPASSSWRLFFP